MPKLVLPLFIALLALPALGPAAHAGDIDDCRSKAEIPNGERMKACSAVIAEAKAAPADLAYAYYRRALTAAADPNVDRAQIIADTTKAIELDPKLLEAYAFRALAYERGMQYDKATADLTSALALSPDRWSFYYLRAMIALQRKDKAQALADFKSALEHNPPETSASMIRQRITKLETPAQ